MPTVTCLQCGCEVPCHTRGGRAKLTEEERVQHRKDSYRRYREKNQAMLREQNAAYARASYARNREAVLQRARDKRRLAKEAKKDAQAERAAEKTAESPGLSEGSAGEIPAPGAPPTQAAA